MLIYTQTDFNGIVMRHFIQNSIIIPNTKDTVKQKVLFIVWLLLLSVC